jgi:hypothetical protein
MNVSVDMKQRITYKFRKANLLEFWNGNNIVAELPVDPAPEQVGRFIAVAGLDVFAAAVNEHGVNLGEALVPIDFFDSGDPFVDRYGLEKYLCKVSDLAQGGLMAVPEIKAKSDELRKLKAEEEDRLAKVRKEAATQAASKQAQAREKASALLKGAQFSHIDEDGEIVLLGKDGGEILVGSYHEVWNYGDESGDSLTVACGSDVLYLTEIEAD